MKKIIYTFFLLCLTSAVFGQKQRQVNFNDNWKFTLGDDLRFRHAAYDDKQWEAITLPHDWSILADFGAAYPAGNAGGALPGGVGWYRKQFQLHPQDKGQDIRIHFGAAYRYTEVWINGHYLGKHSNGYLSFSHDLSTYLHYGDQPNIVAVRVDNSQQPNSRWYSGSGIYRDVQLVFQNPTHFLPAETFISTPLVSKESGALHIAAEIHNPTQQQIVWQAKLLDQKGMPVAEKKVTLTASQVDETLTVDRPLLWDVKTPNLYTLQMAILDKQGKELHVSSQRVGFRTIAFDVKKGFFLNGESLKILGVCLHHDLGAIGATFNKSAAKRQLLIMQEMGANAIRTAHNPPATELLDLCDEMGILVYNEAYDMWQKRKNKFDYHQDFKAHHVSDLQTFIKRDRNHPSVIMWSIGNEIREQFDSTGTTLTKEMVAVVKALDPTRPVTAALTETNYEKNFIAQAQALGVLGFNYKFEDYDKLPKEFKGVPLIASETTSALQTRGVYEALHDTIQFWPASSKDKFVTNGNPDFTISAYDNVAAYWGTSHERAWLEVKKRDFLGGIFVWTGFDYLGEPVPYPYPARSSYYGIVDLAGFPKDVYYMYQAEWTDKEVLHVLPHWNWHVGETVDVWAYYNHADEVELFLNGKSLGKSAKTADRLHAAWKVPYVAGEIKVVKYRDGRAVQEEAKRTAGAAATVKATVKHQAFKTGDARDLYFVEVQLCDDKGQAVAHEDVELTFEGDENAAVLGTDNGFQADLSGLSNRTRKTFKGKALAIVRLENPAKQGSITIQSTLGQSTVSLSPK